MPYDENGEWYEDNSMSSDGGQYAGEAAQPVSYSSVGGGAAPQQSAEDRGGITPVIVHGEGGPAEYNGQMYHTADQASSARALGVRANQTPEQQQAMQPQQDAAQQDQPPNSIQMQEDIDRTSLSRNEQLELTTTQNGISRLQRDARVGLIPPQQAQQMMQQLQQRVQPLMIRQSQLRGMIMAQQYQQREEQMQQASRAAVNDERFRAQSGVGPITQVIGGQTYLQNRRGEWSVVAQPHQPADGRSRGAGTQNDHFDTAYTAATTAVNLMLNDPMVSEEDKARLRTPAGRQQAVEREVQARVDAHQRLATRDHEQRSRLPGGPIPFDPPDPGQELRRLPVRRQMEVQFRDQIAAAMEHDQRGRETQLRRLAGAWTDAGGDSGRLSQEDQQTLQGIGGYYRREFTPEIDREISYRARPVPGPEVRDPSGVRIQQMMPSPLTDASREFREILTAHGGRPPETNRDERRRFDELRGRLGFTVWPPPRQAAATGPAMPVVQPRPAPSQGGMSALSDSGFF